MYNVKSTMNSMLTLEINGDDMIFISNLGKGSIDIAEIRDFEALSGDG